MTSHQLMDGFKEDSQGSRERTSTKLCVAGLVFCWLSGLGSLAAGVYLVRFFGPKHAPVIPSGGVAVTFNKYAKELAPLGLNILVTICNDITGYVHTISLRWALQSEGRLTFNSNLRIFTSARHSRSNAWYTNFMMAIFMIMSYTSTSMIFIGDIGLNNSDRTSHLSLNTNIFVCGYAIVALAIALLGQAAVATICIPNLAKVHTWSPDPLENARACTIVNRLQHRPGRCMQSIHHSKELVRPTSPRHRQRSAFSAHKEVRVVFWCMFIPVIMAVIWGGVILASSRSDTYRHSQDNWSLFPVVNGVSSREQTPSLSVIIPMLNFRRFCLAFGIIGVCQACMTICLHCAELVVNVVRDEKSWRAASHQGRKCSNALSSMLSSGPALILFASKPVIHWLYSLACTVEFSLGISMRAPQIFYLGIGVMIMASFVTVCATWRPKGPQPAAYGHLQTLADLVDEWPNPGERMFWGEKDMINTYGDAPFSSPPEESKPSEELAENDELIEKERVWHAGTATEKLPLVKFERRYMGFVSR